jgi:hypothetical protein
MVAKRRNLQPENVNALKKVRAEKTCVDGIDQRTIRRANQPEIYGTRTG